LLLLPLLLRLVGPSAPEADAATAAGWRRSARVLLLLLVVKATCNGARALLLLATGRAGSDGPNASRCCMDAIFPSSRSNDGLRARCATRAQQGRPVSSC
jgi:hypothetical protein